MANLNTYTLISSVTVGAGGASNINFTSIPQTYTDLVMVISAKSNRSDSNDWCYVTVNGSNPTEFRLMLGEGTGVSSYTSSSGLGVSSSATSASGFGSATLYLPNYASNGTKSFAVEAVQENNTNTAYSNLYGGYRNTTSAVTSFGLTPIYGTAWLQYTTAYLYGVTSVSPSAKATGGVISSDTNYIYHTFVSSGTFTPTQSLTCDYLVVAGGGAGGARVGGGGGAGGLRSTVTATGGGGSLESAISVTAQAYTITVGAGGAGVTDSSGVGRRGTAGGDSSIAGSGLTTITSTGGGGGGAYTNVRPINGYGSGGGGQGYNDPAPGGTGTANQGYAGGVGHNGGAGGGGGAGAIGGEGNIYGAGRGGTWWNWRTSSDAKFNYCLLCRWRRRFC